MAEEQKSKISRKYYTDTMYYTIKLTEKYSKAFILKVFEQINATINPDELMILDIVSTQPDICQRDLAKLIFKDRANTGRLVDGLEKKGLVARQNDTRNNRPIKKIFLTEEGEKTLFKITDYIFPIFNKMAEKFTEEEISTVKDVMKRIRNGFEEIIDSQI